MHTDSVHHAQHEAPRGPGRAAATPALLQTGNQAAYLQCRQKFLPALQAFRISSRNSKNPPYGCSHAVPVQEAFLGRIFNASVTGKVIFQQEQIISPGP